MKCKGFEIVIELEVQAVTCPGVWLCPNGKVIVQIYMLGVCTRTTKMNPVFPLLYHEKFVFKKTFSNIRNLNELEMLLKKEYVYMELIQLEICGNANVLATFKTLLSDLLYPLPPFKNFVTGVDIDLLMEATKRFPGIISPKIEVSTKTTIEQVLCNFKNNEKKDFTVINPKLISSKCVPKRRTPLRQRKVCHTFAYHRARAFKKPDHFKSSTSPKRKCLCNEKSDLKDQQDCVCEKIQSSRKSISSDNEKVQQCKGKCKQVLCPLCIRYENYFEKPCSCKNWKESFCSCKPQRHYCSRKKDKINVDKKTKICKCSLNSFNDVKTEYNTENTTKRSLASNIHNRLQRKLSADDFAQDSFVKHAAHDSTKRTSANDEFYKSLDQFYKQLYRQMHSNAKKRTHKNCSCKDCKNY